jgi:hypothetical protein
VVDGVCLAEGVSKKWASRYQSRQLKFSRRRPFSRFSAHFVKTTISKSLAGVQSIPVHIQDRLSASTDFRLVRPEVANDRSGVGSARTGISEDWPPTIFGDSEVKEERDNLRCIPSTNARNLSSGGDGNSPLWDSRSMSKAVGRDKAEN